MGFAFFQFIKAIIYGIKEKKNVLPSFNSLLVTTSGIHFPSELCSMDKDSTVICLLIKALFLTTGLHPVMGVSPLRANSICCF